MQLYKLELNMIPHVMFAHTYETNHYCYHFNTKPNFMEITYIEKGDVIRELDDGQRTVISAPCVIINFYDRPLTCYSEAPIHRHSTIGISMKYRILPMELQDVKECSQVYLQDGHANSLFLIIPNYLIIDKYNTYIEKLFKKAIGSNFTLDFGYNMDCTGIVLEILSNISRECVHNCLSENKHSLPPGSILYCRRAMNYISMHIDEKIAVENIAEFLGISTGYLSNIFKVYSGQTLIEHINRVKLTKIKELMVDKGLTLKEAGMSVGFIDEHYLSRIFKKYLGINAREYKMYEFENEDFHV